MRRGERGRRRHDGGDWLRGPHRRDSPSALGDHPQMAGYQACCEMLLQLNVTARRIDGSPYGLASLLREKAVRAVLDAGEAGYRLDPHRRGLLYRTAWAATHDCTGILRAARQLRLLPAEAGLADDAVIRRAQQEVTIAMGSNLRRARKRRRG